MSYQYKRRYTGKSQTKFTGPTKCGIYKSAKDGWLKVVAPWNPKFLDEIKSSIQPGHRQWNPEEKFWLINEIYLEDLSTMLNRYYNVVETDLINSEPQENVFNEILNLCPSENIDKLYYALTKVFHPDTGDDNSLITKLNQAYQEKKNA